MKLTILGNPISKKNSMRIVKAGNGRPFLLPSKQYCVYEKDALRCLSLQVPANWKPIDYPVNVKCVYYMQTKRRVDLVNLLEASCDILVKAGFIADDNSNIVVSHDGSRVLYNKEHPCVEITIEPMEGVSADAV